MSDLHEAGPLLQAIHQAEQRIKMLAEILLKLDKDFDHIGKCYEHLYVRLEALKARLLALPSDKGVDLAPGTMPTGAEQGVKNEGTQ